MTRARVLIVEDDEILSLELTEDLEEAGYEVTAVAASGEEALECARQALPDVALMDVRLKGAMDGVEAAAELKGRFGVSSVYLTGNSDAKLLERAAITEPFGYLIKPCSRTALRAAIEIAVCKSRFQSELVRAHEELEKRVQERTAELSEANRRLTAEMEKRARALEHLIESEERFRAVFESARDCVFIKDRELRYVSVNPSMPALLNLPASEVIGRTDGDLFGPTVAEHLGKVDARVLEGETVEEQHTREINGIPTTFLDIRTPLRDASGSIIGVCGISRNITERHTVSETLPVDVQTYPSAAMKAALANAALAAESNSITLITGESGSGKDFIARYIHRGSRRADGPFLTLNCASIPTELAESELFGHESGAFTGAMRRKRGRVELAEGGTLLLNEIGELPLSLQAKLLTFLDTMTFSRVGGEQTIVADIRILAATNRDLQDEVRQGRFREDLYYRLNVFPMEAPPLRERAEDIPILARELICELCEGAPSDRVPAIRPDAVEMLSAYSWPGNVRELRNILERALILARGNTITPEHIQLRRAGPATFPAKAALPEQSLPRFLAQTERALIRAALDQTGGNRRAAAEALGISRFTLARHMKKLEMDK